MPTDPNAKITKLILDNKKDIANLGKEIKAIYKELKGINKSLSDLAEKYEEIFFTSEEEDEDTNIIDFDYESEYGLFEEEYDNYYDDDEYDE